MAVMDNSYQQYTSLTLLGKKYNKAELLKLCETKLQSNETPAWENFLYAFLLEWLNDSPFVKVKTSGSTGTPKTLQVRKSAMLQSAFNTLDFFDLKENKTALLCLPCEFIAGKMMMVRALAGKMDLIPVPVTGTPLDPLKHPVDFAALTPLQMSNQLEKNSDKTHLLKTVILGGSSVSEELTALLQDQPFEAWETYGMTETLSHVALRLLNGSGKDEFFTPLPGVRIETDQRECLVIDVAGITNGPMITNDIVNLNNDGKFKISGRMDNIINSGGIKISPEKIESLISGIISTPFFIGALPHPQLGQQPVLVMENPPEDENELLNHIKKMVPQFHAPKKIIIRNPLPRTENGKIKRTLNG
jgi:O-succinylbenzoic acid--CoA ligase